MPRLHGVTEIKFVKPFIGEDGKETWRDQRGYSFKVVDEHHAIEAYAEMFDRNLMKTRDQIKLCAELGHDADPGGCGGLHPGGGYRCSYWLKALEECCRSPERTRGAHVGRQHLRARVMGADEKHPYEGMTPDHPWIPTVHRIRWYSRNSKVKRATPT